MQWLPLTFIAMVLISVGWLGPSLARHWFGVQATPFVVWYFGAIALTSFIYASVRHGLQLVVFAPSLSAVVWLIAFGVLIGGVSHIMLFEAITRSHENSAYPASIINVAGVLAVVLAYALYSFWPSLFPAASLNMAKMSWAIISIIGVIGFTLSK